VKVDGRHFRSIWLEQDGWSVGAIDQRRLPHEFVIARPRPPMRSGRHPQHAGPRGALIGATAAYGMALAVWTIVPTPASIAPANC
jgi:methylthioribose-1-phosphate isomerase